MSITVRWYVALPSFPSYYNINIGAFSLILSVPVLSDKYRLSDDGSHK